MNIQPEIKLPLTDPQSEILAVIGNFLQRRHYPPTITEIQQELGISNPGTVHKALTALEKKEYITKEKNIARGIRLTPLGAEICAQERQLTLELDTFHRQ
jgi:repressor LexA